MRLSFFSTVLFVSIAISSCGSGGSGGGDNGNNGNNNNGDGNGSGGSPGQPLTDAQCTEAWTSYVRSRPKGLKLTYENRNMGSTTTSTIEVTASSDAAVTEKHMTGNQTDSTDTTTQNEFMKACKTVPSEEIPANATVEERRKESKTVRAGIFSTDYMRIRMTQTDDGTSVVTVSEIWNNAQKYDDFMVYQKSTTSMGSYTFETTTELVSIRRP
jgi:hypothetical protein